MNGTKHRKNDDNAKLDQEIMIGLLNRYDKMVHKFVHEAATNTVCSVEDLVQEGKMAVIRAYRTYDEAKGASLSTWTYHNVKDAILEYQKQNLNLLSGGAYLYHAMKKAGDDATVEDLMELGLSKKTALASTYFNLMPAQYGEAFNMADRKAKKKLEEIESLSRNYKQYLTEKEIFALESYFGLGYSDVLTMEEIGKQLGKSRKAVSYLINQAIVKLRHVKDIEVYNVY